MDTYSTVKAMIFSDGKSLQKKTIAVKGIVFYVKYFAITYPILATLAILAHLLKWDISDHIVNGVFREAIMGHPMNAILVIALFAPLLEEIVFRLWLSFSKKDIAVSSFCLCYLVPRNARLSKADNVWLAWFYQFRVHDGYWLQDFMVTFGKRPDSCYLYEVAVSHYAQGQRCSGSGLCASLYAPACHQL